jgi:hypothetical protein
MILTIVKIDICKSKQFASKHETANPSVRRDALNQLLSVSSGCFPRGEDTYPEGTFYQAEGDSVYYVLDKPSVALRGAIEFMQSWYYHGLSEYPECRVVIDRGYVEEVAVPGKKNLTGKPLENISVIEKELGDGKVYLTNEVLANCDQTMAKFSFFNSFTPREGDTLKVYWADFADPRTIADTGLIHAFFVAHPKAAEARDRVFELFAVEYLLECGSETTLNAFIVWARARDYPVLTTDRLRRVLEASEFLEYHSGDTFWFRPGSEEKVITARKEFSLAKEDCVSRVRTSVCEATGRESVVADVQLDILIDDYLAAVFGEFRMMANYFRATSQLFGSSPDQFARFDYILRRHLQESQLSCFKDWRRGFIAGLREVSEGNNSYIAAVFHNVLATYYLNRSAQASPYQVEKMREREIFLDTNVLYSLLVPASQFHQLTRYFVDRLVKIGVKVRISPLTLQEYEDALSFVAKNWDEQGPRDILVTRNPWLYQEFMVNQAQYVRSIGVCKRTFSLAKDILITEKNFDELSRQLAKFGLALERNWIELSEQEIDDLWFKLRNEMTSSFWSNERYWEFIGKDFPPSVRKHDMTCIENLSLKAEELQPDALGPRILFITVDSKLYRLRRRYPFIVTPEQFMEFILPYLFLSDVPLVDADKFPNQLLAAQLATLLVRRPPMLTEIVAAYFKNPELKDKDASHVFPSIGEDEAAVLNDERFRGIVRELQKADQSIGTNAADQVSELLTELIQEKRQMEAQRGEMAALRKQLAALEEKREEQTSEMETKIEKLQKTLNYWRSQARGPRS